MNCACGAGKFYYYSPFTACVVFDWIKQMKPYIFALSLLLAPVAQAADIVTPSGPYSYDTGCLIKGLDPNGDGFLALRAGPASKFQQIGSLHNGDAAYIRKCQGKWCYVENGAINNKEAKFRGWIYTAWCQFYP